MLKSIISLCAVALFSVSATAADVNPKTKQLIDTLLEQTGQSAQAVGMQMSNAFTSQLANVLKQSNPDIDPKAYDILQEVVSDTIEHQLFVKKAYAKLIYPIYSKHFTDAELQQIIDLYNTPIGQKILSTMPAIMQESMQAGQQWGMSLGPIIQQRLMQRLEQEGISLE